MLNIDQVKLLEGKVEKAVNLIKTLSFDNDSLKKEIEAKNRRISELENLIVAFKDDQTKIEQGIINALNQLSAFENSVSTKRIAETKTQTGQTFSEQEKQTVQGEINREQNPTEQSESAVSPENKEQEKSPEGVPEGLLEKQSAEQTEELPLQAQSEKPRQTQPVLEKPEANPLQKDLDDILGSPSEINKQMDIF
ncbi:cell division protein ZapB [Treponema pedis]|uniref:cell division protein ZapB n=1 Tax=Treponema pedis TaxID=409322 RepID=UPI003D1FA0BC